MKLSHLYVLPLLFTILIGCRERTKETTTRTPAQPVAARDTDLQVVNGWPTAERISREGIQSLIAQVREQRIDRLRISAPLPDRDHETHAEILEQIMAACPTLIALELYQVSLSPSMLTSSWMKRSNLRELRLTDCFFSAADNDWSERTLGLEVLSLRSCEGFLDEHVGRLLSATPNLQELTVAAPVIRGEPFTARDWPLSDLRSLRKVTTYNATDELVRRVVGTASALTSLELSHNEQLTGERWTFLNADAFEALHLASCNALSEENINRILQQFPALKSLSLTGYGDVTGSSLDPKPLASLTSLRLAGPKLDCDFVARTVANAKHLESLRLQSIYPAQSTPIQFGHLKRLRNLYVDGCSVPADFPASLSTTIEHLHIGHCNVTNDSITAMLPRMQRLKTLDLYWLSGPSGRESHPQAITGDGWDFSPLVALQELDLSKSRFLKNALIPRLARQVPGLKKLALGENLRLTGEDWNLTSFQQLSDLSMRDMSSLEDDAINRLPRSLRRLQLERCPRLAGTSWKLASFPHLESLNIVRCSELVSLGTTLPSSLRELSAVECDKLRCNALDYTRLQSCRLIRFRDCRSLDVDRLFLNIADCTQLRSLDLSGCPDVTTRGWDLRPLKKTLASFRYDEGDPSYFGGASKETADELVRQLSDRFESNF